MMRRAKQGESSTRRAVCCPSTCFVLFVIVSLLTHIAELFLNAVYIWFVHSDTAGPAWTATTLGFLILPLVVTQLFSAVLHLQRKQSQEKNTSTLLIAAAHILQVGFIWRHLRILTEENSEQRKKLLVDLLLLRLVFCFTSGLPLLLLQTYYIVSTDSYHGIQMAAMIVCLLSTSWALASFRRQNEACDVEKVVLTWPGIIFRLLWRIGEVTARVLSLAVFACSYKYWTFLVIGLHWLTMLVCIWVGVLGTVDRKQFSRAGHVMVCIAIGYVYIFTHLNFSPHRAKCRYISYYGIIFLETGVLVASWLIHSPSWVHDTKSVSLLATIATAFLLSVISLTIYYGCFHIQLSKVPTVNADICIDDGCINCKLSLCTKHSQVLQRPFNSGWNSQYQNALYRGHYYKNVLQDSLIDSASEREDRGRGNVSFNDREVELIMNSGAVSLSPSNKVDVHPEPPNRKGRPRNDKSDGVNHLSRSLDGGTSPQAVTGATLKGGLDLYHNLNDIQLEKSYDSSIVLKDNAANDSTSLNGSLLQMDSEVWYCDGIPDARSLDGYNLPVSCISGNASDAGQHARYPPVPDVRNVRDKVTGRSNTKMPTRRKRLGGTSDENMEYDPETEAQETVIETKTVLSRRKEPKTLYNDHGGKRTSSRERGKTLVTTDEETRAIPHANLADKETNNVGLSAMNEEMWNTHNRSLNKDTHFAVDVSEGKKGCPKCRETFNRARERGTFERSGDSAAKYPTHTETGDNDLKQQGVLDRRKVPVTPWYVCQDDTPSAAQSPSLSQQTETKIAPNMYNYVPDLYENIPPSYENTTLLYENISGLKCNFQESQKNALKSHGNVSGVRGSAFYSQGNIQEVQRGVTNDTDSDDNPEMII